MSIKFYCSCGKRLKAKDAMAARRTVCPACGNPVGIPSMQPTQRGTAAAPMSPLERLARQRQQVAATTGPATLTTALPEEPPVISSDPPLKLSAEFDPDKLSLPLQTTGIRLRALPRKQRRWQAWPLERHWHESLFYPLLAFPLVLGLGLLFTIMSGVAKLIWPTIIELPEQEPYLWWVPCIFFPVVLIGYSFGFFRCVLASALAGEAGEIRWPGHDILLVLKSTLLGAIALLEGPLLLIVIAYFFWLEGGDPGITDRLILWELLVAAAAHFVVLFLAVSLSNRLRDANPVRLVELVIQLGWRGQLLVLAGAILTVGDGLLILDTLENLEATAGWLALFACWAGGFYLATLFFRWLGLYCHYHFKLGRHRES